MSIRRPFGFLALMLAVAGTACAAPPALTTSNGESLRVAAPKRVNAGLEGMLLNFGATEPPAGAAPLLGILEGGLYERDKLAVQLPTLVEAVPTIENGLWRLFPDGRMEMTWRLREGARWHDGTPVTSADVLFAAAYAQDPRYGNATGPLRLVEALDAPDNRTVVVKWKEPYIAAHVSFSSLKPSHVLEQAFQTQESTAFLQHPYWTNGFVGAGPFKLKEFAPGSHVVIEAFDQYVLGRPKIDEINVRFFTDVNTMVANILAGTVELTFSRGLTMAQALQLREHWDGGTMDMGFDNWFALWPQMLSPDPAIITDLRFRRALLHSIDRQGIVDNLWGGFTQMAHAMVQPTEPGYREYVEPNIMKYDYDVRRTAALMEELGYRRGADGLYVSAAGQAPRIQVQSSGGDDAHDQGAVVIVDYFKQAGIDAYPFLIPDAQRTNRELISNYPGVGIWRGANDVLSFNAMHSRQAAVAPPWTTASNRSRYMNPEFDALIDRYFTTVSAPERLPLMGQIMKHTTEQLNVMPLWYNIRPNAVGKRLRNVGWQQVTKGTMFGNAHEWDVVE